MPQPKLKPLSLEEWSRKIDAIERAKAQAALVAKAALKNKKEK